VRTSRIAPSTPRSLLALLLALAAVGLAVVGPERELRAAVAAEDLARAVAAQRALVASRPADAAAQEDLGSLLALAGDFDGAELAYRAAIELDPRSASAQFQLGTVLERRGQERKALAAYRRAIEIDPGHAWAHYEAGSIWARWGVDTLARRAYAKALALDRSLADPSVNPHILDNRLATSAMIQAYREHLPEPTAPRTFHEPARIAALILDRPSAGDQQAAEPAAVPAEEPGG
jgi:Flp pilus assembly protein TadD